VVQWMRYPAGQYIEIDCSSSCDK